MLLPYLDQEPLYKQIDFDYHYNSTYVGINGVTNRSITRTTLPALLCPSDPGASVKYTAAMGPTSYALSSGPGSHWSMRTNMAGFTTLWRGSVIRDITDGTSNTIAGAELQLGQNKGRWQTPSDPSERIKWYRVTGAGRLQKANNTNGRKFRATAADMAVINGYYSNCLSRYDSGTGWNGASDEQGRYWATGRVFWGPWHTTLVGPNAGPSCDNDNSVTDMSIKEPSSYHPGGVHVLLADGATRFVNETIDQGIWIALGSRDGGDTIGEF